MWKGDNNEKNDFGSLGHDLLSRGFFRASFRWKLQVGRF
jgi:hypothetical protein